MLIYFYNLSTTSYYNKNLNNRHELQPRNRLPSPVYQIKVGGEEEELQPTNIGNLKKKSKHNISSIALAWHGLEKIKIKIY